MTLSDKDKPGSALELVDLTSWLPPLDSEAKTLLEGYYGSERLASIRRSLTTAPGYTCIRINRLQVADVAAATKEVNEALKDYFAKLARAAGSRHDDAPLCASPYPHAPLSEDTIIIPSVRCPLEGLSSTFPSADDRVVVVGRLCGEAVLRGADVFSAGVICTSNSISEGTQVILLIDLDSATTQGVDFYSEYRGPAAFIGRGVARTGRAAMFRERKGLAVEVKERLGWEAPPLNRFMSGRVYAQNLPSVVVSHVLRPRPGETVIDLCAGPGGKTSHLASLMENRGLLVSCDRSRKKVLEIRDLCQESGATCVTPLVMDSAHALLSRDWWLKEKDLPSSQPGALLEAAPMDKDGLRSQMRFFPETFDHVLLDPPCTALGLRPRFAIDVTAKGLNSAADYQRTLFWSAVMLLRPGGHLVYSTCTISPLENEAMVRHALDRYHPCLQLVPAEPRVGGGGVQGAGLSDEERAMLQSFDPSCQEVDTTGFFCAKFVKRCSVFMMTDHGPVGEGEGGEGEGGETTTTTSPATL